MEIFYAYTKIKYNVIKKGYKYNIYIVVYGLQPIKMSASIEGWHEEKDPIIVDPDDPKYDNNPDDPNDEDNLRAE